MRDTNADPILTAILRLAGPAVLTFWLQNAYHLNDAFFLGRHGSVSANAMGLFMIVMIANFGFILTLARGTQSLVARRFGAGQREGAGLALAQGMSLAVKVLLPLVILEWIFAPDILRFMGGRGEVVVEATRYLRTLFLFMPILYAQPMFDFAFQAMGDTATPFRFGCIAVLVNLVLNTLLVLDEVHLHWVLGGVTLVDWVVPSAGLGVVGAAVATGTSRLVTSVLAFRKLVRRYKLEALTCAASYLPQDRRVAREILRVGVPTGASTFLYAAVAMFMTQVMEEVGGQDAFGAFGIGFRGVESVSFMMVLGFGVATGTVAAHAVGAGDIDRARRSGHVGALAGAAVMCVTATLFLIFPEQLAGLYTTDAAIIAIAATYISTMALCQVPQALEMIYADAMAGAGSSARTALITIPGNIVRIPLAWFFALTLDMGLRGVWYAIVASAVLKGVGVLVLYVSGKWEKAMLHGRRLLDVA